MSRRLTTIAAILGLFIAFSGTGPATGTPFRERTLDVPIFMYHRNGPLSGSLLVLAVGVPQSLHVAEQMRLLHAHGFHAITHQHSSSPRSKRGARLPRRPVLITFERRLSRRALECGANPRPALALPATAYVITGRISGPDSGFLTWPELRRPRGARHREIGSHTVHHAALPLLSGTAARHELVDSRRRSRRHLGHPVVWFAYPIARR
jgi:peptidoglycan/xylan/chitin deacetylase (PgdA/CDA1 family)